MEFDNVGKKKMANDKAIEILATYRDYIAVSEAEKDAAEMAIEALKRQRWIPCSERMPKDVERCLTVRFDFVTKTSFVDILWYENGNWWNRHYHGNYNVTHWMPVPELRNP